MELRIDQLIETIKFFLLETDIINYIVSLIAVLYICLIYTLCMYIRYKIKIHKRWKSAMIFIIIGAFIIFISILFLGIDVTIIAPIIIYLILILKSLFD